MGQNPEKDEIIWNSPSGAFYVRPQLEEIGGRPECVAVCIRPATKRPLRTSDLRSIPLGKVIELALKPEEVAWELAISRRGVVAGPRLVRRDGGEVGRGRQPDDPLRLAQAALVYERGGRNPVRKVAEAFHLSRSGAAKLVARARAAGFLTATARRKVGGRMTAKARRLLEKEDKS